MQFLSKVLKVIGYLQEEKKLLKFWFLAHSYGFSVTCMRKKEIVEKSKYWRRNDGFSFVPEVKVTHLIDSPIHALNKSGRHLFFFNLWRQSRKDFSRHLWVLTRVTVPCQDERQSQGIMNRFIPFFSSININKYQRILVLG